MSLCTFDRTYEAHEVNSSRRGLLSPKAVGALASSGYTNVNADFAQSCDFGGFGANNSAMQDYFNPVRDRLDRGSVIEEWIPHSLPALNRMFRQIYARDAIAGPAVDIWSMLPWSEFDIVGLEDEYPDVAQFYKDALIPIFTPETLESISKEYLVHGRFCGNLLFDNAKGYWTDLIPNDPDFIEVKPNPLINADPFVDLRVSPGLMQFMYDPDPRVAFARGQIPSHFLNMIRATGLIPLDPFNTLWVARKISPYDTVGTSLLTRILPYWAIEKPLLNATVIAARRRAGAILHVTMETTPEQGGMPTSSELQEIAGMFIQADTDPVGSVVATRAGITATEVSQGGQIWKLSDEGPFLVENKMRAVGVTEAWLTGEASYNNYDDNRSIFMDQVRTLRERIVAKTIMAKAEVLARLHGFVRTKKSRVDHRIKVKKLDKYIYNRELNRPTFPNLSIEEAMAIPREDLILPTIQFDKTLKAEGDMHLLELVEKIEEKGVPITLRTWANLGGISLDDQVNDMATDMELKKQIKDMKAEYGGEGDGEGEEGGGEDEGFSLGSYNKNDIKKLSPVETFNKFKNLVSAERSSIKNGDKHLLSGY